MISPKWFALQRMPWAGITLLSTLAACGGGSGGGGGSTSASSSSSSSSSDSESAAKVVGIILVVLGNVLDEVGKAILNTDHGNGITLLTNLWLGFVLTGVPVVWPESR